MNFQHEKHAIRLNAHVRKTKLLGSGTYLRELLYDAINMLIHNKFYLR